MIDRLDETQARIDELNRELQDPKTVKDRQRMTTLSKELGRLRPLAEAWGEYRTVKDQIAEAELMLNDPEMRDLAREELPELEESLEKIETNLKLLLLPPDPYEGRDVLLEIRAGTGGDEAALFAGDLFRMYLHYAEVMRWKVEIYSSSEVVAGGSKSAGYKEIICRVSGQNVYSQLRFESGVHRVQRVPVTETQGRIHTSAATVAVLPEAEPVEVNIQQSDLRIDVMRAGGPGGQSVNTTDSAVRITHIPTGMVVICQDEKSQHKNKARAMSVLASRLLQKEQDEQAQKEAANRKAQVGTGDRSERIRTYNFPQNRVTDHRINLTLYKLDRVMLGDISEIVVALQTNHQAELIKEHT